MTNEEYNTTIENDAPDFRTILDRYLKYWPWFLVSIIIAISIAFVKLSLTKKNYYAEATIIIKDEKGKGPGASEESGLAGLSMLGGISTSSIENELGLLRSKRLMKNSVKALNLNIQYFEKEGFIEKEYYKNSPYVVRPVSIDEKALSKAIGDEKNSFIINYVSDTEVDIIFENDTAKNKKVKLGELVSLDFANFSIHNNESEQYQIQNLKDVTGVKVRFITLASAAASFSSSLSVQLVNENSTLIALGVIDEVGSKAKDVLDQLVFEYNQEAIADKDLIARNTAFFIDERLALINSELDSVESGKEKFKESNLLTDIEAESNLIVKNVSDYNNQKQQINTELELTNALINHLRNNSSNLIPSNMGIDDSGTNSSISAYNALVLERNKLARSASEQNPTIVNLNSQIDQLRENVMQSLIGRQNNLQIKKNSLDLQSGILASQISDVPSQERAYRGIERQQNIKESLYIYLLQKREENSLSLAAKAPKAKLVDEAYVYGTPVSPNPKIIFAVALLIGLFLPFLYINIKNILNNKIENSEEVKKLAKSIPLFGELPHINSSDRTLIQADTRSVLSESFHILTSNIQHYSETKIALKKSTCIFVTSSLKGEGKTFTSINLGISLASSGNSVLVIGADLRNPQLHNYQTDSKKHLGLSEFLNGSSESIIGFVKDTSLHDNLKFIYTGDIPNNPIELLKKVKLERMFEELENLFDYIIVDTAPVLQLADTYIISKYADMTLFMVRAAFTKKKFLEFALEAQQNGRLKNLGLVVNDVKLNNTLYGNSYSYGA